MTENERNKSEQEKSRITLELVVNDEEGNPLLSHYLIYYPNVFSLPYNGAEPSTKMPAFHYFGSFPSNEKLEFEEHSYHYPSDWSPQFFFRDLPLRILTHEEEKLLDITDDFYAAAEFTRRLASKKFTSKDILRNRVIQNLYEDCCQDIEEFLANPSLDAAEVQRVAFECVKPEEIRRRFYEGEQCAQWLNNQFPFAREVIENSLQIVYQQEFDRRVNEDYEKEFERLNDPTKKEVLDIYIKGCQKYALRIKGLDMKRFEAWAQMMGKKYGK